MEKIKEFLGFYILICIWVPPLWIANVVAKNKHSFVFHWHEYIPEVSAALICALSFSATILLATTKDR